MDLTINGISYSVAIESGVYQFSTASRSIAVSSISLNEAVAVAFIRKRRDSELVESDWRMVMDYPLNDQADWQTYRQSLRDMPSTYSTDTDIAWPTPPST